MLVIVISHIRLRKFFTSKLWWNDNPHNPPNDYELILLIIICYRTFYDKSFKIIKKCQTKMYKSYFNLAKKLPNMHFKFLKYNYEKAKIFRLHLEPLRRPFIIWLQTRDSRRALYSWCGLCSARDHFPRSNSFEPKWRGRSYSKNDEDYGKLKDS